MLDVIVSNGVTTDNGNVKIVLESAKQDSQFNIKISVTRRNARNRYIRFL